jgi:hypothetical protein
MGLISVASGCALEGSCNSSRELWRRLIHGPYFRGLGMRTEKSDVRSLVFWNGEMRPVCSGNGRGQLH